MAVVTLSVAANGRSPSVLQCTTAIDDRLHEVAARDGVDPIDEA